jgi:hypothetical protein
MSLRSVTYELCKKVWSSKHRTEIKALIWSLNTATEEQIKSGNHRSSFGLVARQFRAQALGYLVVNRDRDKIAKDYPPLRWTSGLTHEEICLLAGTHKQLAQLDQVCLSPLTEKNPQFIPAVDPYHRFGYQLPDEVTEVDLFTNKDKNALANNFSQHPAFKIIFESMEIAKKSMPEDQLIKAANGLEVKLLQSGPLHTPKDLDYLANIPEVNAPERITFRFFSALLCLRASIDILNELIYQAILVDKLPVFSEKNVIDYETVTAHLGGTGISLLCQPDDIVMDLGLALIKDPSFKLPVDLCRIEAIKVEASNEFGDVAYVLLRQIDEYLNPYSHLLKQI